MRYYVLHNKRQYGPFHELEIQELLSAGILTYNDLVAPEGTTKFLSIAKTDLIFAPASATVHVAPTDLSPSQPEPSTNTSAAPEVSATLESTVTKGMKPDLFKSLKNFWLTILNTCKKLPQFFVTRIISRSPIKGTLFGRTLEVFVLNFYIWLTILAVPLIVQEFLFSKTCSAIFRLLFPSPEPIGISFPGQVVEMIVVITISIYLTATAILMAIMGASELYERRELQLKQLFTDAQRKLPSFALVAMEFSLIYMVMVMSAIFLPDRLEYTGKYVAELLFILLAYRLFAVPFIIILEKIGISEAHRISTILLQKKFKPVFYSGLIYILLKAGFDFLVRFYPSASVLSHLLQLLMIILMTYFYKHLSKTALIQKKYR